MILSTIGAVNHRVILLKQINSLLEQQGLILFWIGLRQRKQKILHFSVVSENSLKERTALGGREKT